MSAAAIEGVTVRLEPVAPDVAAALLAGRTPTGIAFAPGYPSAFSLEVMDMLVGPRAAEHGPGAFNPSFVVRKDDATVVGEIGFSLEEGSATATLGYSIVEPCWGRGYATDALRALLAHLRGDPRVRRIEAGAPVGHGTSRRVMEKAGMRLCDERLEQQDGELVELAVYVAP